MALTRVQSNIANGSSTVPSVDIGSVPASGDLVVVSVAIRTGGRTITLPGYTLIPTDGNVSNGTNVQHALFYKTATGAGGTDVITASISGTAVNWRIIATQYHDSAGGSWSLDKSAHATGTSAAPSSGTTAATAVTNEVWVGALTTRGSLTQSAPTNSFSLVQGASASPGSYLYERIVSATGTANVAATIASSTAWVGTVATFYTGAAAGSPGNTVAPAVTGTTVVGSTLTSSTGTWTNSPTSFGYQWQRDTHGDSNYTNISGATASTRVLVDADDACKLRCQVIATNASGSSTPANSNAVGPVTEPAPVNTIPPVISGMTIQYQRLTTTPGSWTNMGGYAPTYAYQWQTSPDGTTGWTNITGAISNTYVLGAADIGNYIRISAIATNTGGTGPITSNVLGAITGVPVYHYTDLIPSYDWDLVFNKWTGTRENGSPQTWEDTASQENYFLRAKQVQSLVSTDGELLNQIQWKTAQFAQPMNRVESITIMPLKDAGTATSAPTSGSVYGAGVYGSGAYGGGIAALGLSDDVLQEIDAGFGREIGDRIVVQETPPGFADQESGEYIIQHLAGEVVQGPYTSARLTFQLWPASMLSFWIVGDPAQSLAGVSTRVSY